MEAEQRKRLTEKAAEYLGSAVAPVWIDLAVAEALRYCRIAEISEEMEPVAAYIAAAMCRSGAAAASGGAVTAVSEGDRSVSYDVSGLKCDPDRWRAMLEPFRRRVGFVPSDLG